MTTDSGRLPRAADFTELFNKTGALWKIEFYISLVSKSKLFIN